MKVHFYMIKLEIPRPTDNVCTLKSRMPRHISSDERKTCRMEVMMTVTDGGEQAGTNVGRVQDVGRVSYVRQGNYFQQDTSA